MLTRCHPWFPPSRISCHSISLHPVAETQRRWKGIGELKNEQSADESDHRTQTWDCDSDDPGNTPVPEDRSGEDDTAFGGKHRGCFEILSEDVLVEDLDADIAVQDGRDDDSDERDNILSYRVGQFMRPSCSALFHAYIAEDQCWLIEVKVGQDRGVLALV